MAYLKALFIKNKNLVVPFLPSFLPSFLPVGGAGPEGVEVEAWPSLLHSRSIGS